MDNATNKPLYRAVLNDARRTFKRFPSMYASMWIQKEYKKRGGEYLTPKTKAKDRTGGKRWLDEKWVQILPYLKGQEVKCGSDNKDSKACRPLVRKSKDTPPTLPELIKEFGETKVKHLATKKNKDMEGRLNWKKGIFTPSS